MINVVKDFFDYVKTWSFGREPNLKVYNKNINARVTESQKKLIQQLVKQGDYKTISIFLRAAIENELKELKKNELGKSII